MKKLIILFSILLAVIIGVILFFVLRQVNWYNNFEKYGFENYTDTKWVCSEPEITYTIPKIDYYKAKASTEINGNTIVFSFDTRNRYVEANGYPDDLSYHEPLFTGSIEYYEDKFVVSIDRESDTLFSGEYSELVFVRVSD